MAATKHRVWEMTIPSFLRRLKGVTSLWEKNLFIICGLSYEKVTYFGDDDQNGAYARDYLPVNRIVDRIIACLFSEYFGAGRR